MLNKLKLPSTWAPDNYKEKIHSCVKISSFSDEYREVERYFTGYRVLKIERVQNPYQYGKYEVYKLEKRFPPETILFKAIESSQLEKALRYNCDYRYLNDSSCSDKFFDSVSLAVNRVPNSNTIIVLQVLREHKEHNSGRYPKYVVTFENIPACLKKY